MSELTSCNKSSKTWWGKKNQCLTSQHCHTSPDGLVSFFLFPDSSVSGRVLILCVLLFPLPYVLQLVTKLCLLLCLLKVNKEMDIYPRCICLNVWLCCTFNLKKVNLHIHINLIIYGGKVSCYLYSTF